MTSISTSSGVVFAVLNAACNPASVGGDVIVTNAPLGAAVPTTSAPALTSVATSPSASTRGLTPQHLRHRFTRTARRLAVPAARAPGSPNPAGATLGRPGRVGEFRSRW
jgi:hypothetical protein